MFFPSFMSSRPVDPPPNDAVAADGGSVTGGRFDPTALERGAKALKVLDASPNASKAFELTRLQECTRQKETQARIEELQTMRSRAGVDKARVEGEERRKTISHQQQEERGTAQYRAELDAESYAKKLQEQQKQNEEWLQKQQAQFILQEQIKKQTELEIAEKRRRQLQEEKALERESIKTRVREETAGRIKRERENLDVRLKEYASRATEDRRTKLESLQVIFSSIGAGAKSLIEDKRKLYAVVGGISGVALGVYAARAGTGVFGKYLESQLGRPPLVRETSRWSLTRSISRAFLWPRYLFQQKKLQEQIVLPNELSERLQWATNSLMMARRNGAPFRHLLLFGPPGTGKTLFARTLARQSGLDYAIMTGGDVAPLGRLAVAELQRVFSWAKRSRRGLVLFIDEADAFLRQGRGGTHGEMSEDVRNALSAFLHQTGTETKSLCVVLATNVKEILDKAVLDRIDEQFELPLPAPTERRDMLKMFFRDFLTSPRKGRRTKVDPAVTDDEFLSELVDKTLGFSGRQLAKLVLAMQSAVFGSGSPILTKGLASTVLDWRLRHFGDDDEVVVRKSRESKLQQHAATMASHGSRL